MANKEQCSVLQGPLPECSPLANAVTPVQTAYEPAYDRAEALVKGTLFPGLDLPFMDYVAKKPLARTPENELSALDFVSHELALYLDTHASDKEAFAAWRAFDKLAKTAHERYTELYGPVRVCDQQDDTRWRWNDDPWPWELCGREEG